MSHSEPVVLAEVVRSGFVESRHRGSLIVLDETGDPTFHTGNVTDPIFPRSANKPVQAAAMVRAGLPLDGELLALAAASHSGEEFHIDGARRILTKFGLTDTDLQNTPQWPIGSIAQREYIRAGGEPSAIAANCSGKHAAMLATCVTNGWHVASYLDPRHPLQQAIKGTIAELAAEPVAFTGVDGCGAPLFAVSLLGVARMFRALATAAASSPEGRVAEAIREFPDWVSGTTRDEAHLIRSVPGLIAKVGAEAVFGIALPDGRAVALKIDDGADRARVAAARAVLRDLGFEIAQDPDHEENERTATVRATISI